MKVVKLLSVILLITSVLHSSSAYFSHSCICKPDTRYCADDFLYHAGLDYLEMLNETPRSLGPLTQFAPKTQIECKHVQLPIFDEARKLIEDHRLYVPVLPQGEGESWYPNMENLYMSAGPIIAIIAMEFSDAFTFNAAEEKFIQDYNETSLSEYITELRVAKEYVERHNFHTTYAQPSPQEQMKNISELYGPVCNATHSQLAFAWRDNFGGEYATWPHSKITYLKSFFGRGPVPLIPCVVLLPHNAQQAADALDLVQQYHRNYSIPFTIKGAGHSAALFSYNKGGVVLDMQKMTDLNVTTNPHTGATVAEVGAGNMLISVYAKLFELGYIIPAGSCPSVGAVGLAIGGGYGYATLIYGVLTDSVTQLDVVTADGRSIVANHTSNEDLFWSCRGGLCANSALVTKITFAIQPRPETVVVFMYHWKISDSVPVVQRWQAWVNGTTPINLGSAAIMFKKDSTTGWLVELKGLYFGPETEYNPIAAQLLTGLPATNKTYVKEMSFIQSVLYLGGCNVTKNTSHDVNDCEAQAQKEATGGGRTITDFVSREAPWNETAINKIVELILQSEARINGSYVTAYFRLYAWGDSVWSSKQNTSWIHKDSAFIIQYMLDYAVRAPYYFVDASNDTINRGIQYLEDTKNQMKVFTSGGAYQNFVDLRLNNTWSQEYYGDYYTKLQKVKQEYDPLNFFHNPQSVKPLDPVTLDEALKNITGIPIDPSQLADVNLIGVLEPESSQINPIQPTPLQPLGEEGIV